MEYFIRDKYEKKKYISPIPIATLPIDVRNLILLDYLFSLCSYIIFKSIPYENPFTLNLLFFLHFAGVWNK